MIPNKERRQLNNQSEVAKREMKAQEQDGKQLGKITSPKEWDGYLWRAGWRNYKNAWERNPLEVVKLLLYKAVRFFFATDSGEYQKHIFFIQIPFLILSIMGLVSIIRSHRYSNELWLMVMGSVYFWGIFVVMFPLARYTVPILPFLAIFVSGLVKNQSRVPVSGGIGSWILK